MKRFIVSVSIIGALAAPAFAVAATLSFTAPQTSVGIGEPIEVSVFFDTKNAINAIEAAVIIPSRFELKNMSDGNTIMSLWVERPRYDRETRTISFSGIIPGGFLGTGQLLKLTLKAEAAGSAALSFDRTRTTVYQNGPDGTPEPTTLRSLTLNAEAGTVVTVTPIVDIEPPEKFVPVVTRDPQLYEGAWTLIFATQDKGSGIAYYEVSESPVRMIDPTKLSWTKAESPYRLLGEESAKYIYVRAVDEQGNIRTELYTQAHPLSWLLGLALGILILALILLVLQLLRKKRRHASP